MLSTFKDSQPTVAADQRSSFKRESAKLDSSICVEFFRSGDSCGKTKLVTGALLVVTSALLVVTRSYFAVSKTCADLMCSPDVLRGIAQNATIWTTRVNSMDSKLASQGAALLVPLILGLQRLRVCLGESQKSLWPVWETSSSEAPQRMGRCLYRCDHL